MNSNDEQNTIKLFDINRFLLTSAIVSDMEMRRFRCGRCDGRVLTPADTDTNGDRAS